jgi:hypothetical protein
MLIGKIETRTWKTNYRGLVLICSSKKFYTDSQVEEITGKALLNKMLDGFRWLDSISKEMDYFKDGFAIGLGKLVDCRPMVEADEEKTFVKFNPKLYCHIYENVIPVKPFEFKGCQGWKTLDEETKNRIILLNS